jgi:multiple sugar transport system ATP-binding protein
MADIVFDRVDKTYENGYRAIANLNLTIEDGAFLVLVGPSGCGKSTALRMVAGLEDITAGELRIGGRRVNEAPPRERDVAMVFQSYALYPHLSVFENIAFGLRLRKMDKKEINKRVRHAAGVLGLTEFLDRKPRMLSGGQRQRVAMGRAIVREPAAFLMDEPLSNLDAKLRGQMRNEVAKLQKDLGVTTLYVTHDQIEAMTMGDRVAVLNGGVLQQSGTPREIYVDPDNLFVAGFMGSPPMNMAIADVEVDGDQVIVVVGGQRLTVDPELVNERPAIRRYDGKQVVVGVRPEDVRDFTEKPDHPRDRTLRAEVEMVEALGSEQVVHFDVATAPIPTSSPEGGPVLVEPEQTSTTWVAMFSPRAFVRLAETVDFTVETSRLYFFDLDTGLSIRS